jgi:hypothetical protein
MLTAGPQWHFSPCQGSGLRDSKIPKLLAVRIPDIPMTKKPIDDFLSGLSPMALITSTRPPLMDGPD